MKRAIIYMLVFSILYSGLAWSAGIHNEEVSCHAGEMSLSPDLDTQSDNNCCSSITVLSNISADVAYSSSSFNTIHSLKRFYSLIVTPPTPPPTS